MPMREFAWPPLICGAILRAASWIVPAPGRHQWHARRAREVDAWWILVERGDVTLHSFAGQLLNCWGAFPDAIAARCSREAFQHFLRGPGLLSAAVGALSGVAGVLTGGFAQARRLLQIAFTENPADSDALIASGFLLLFALGAGAVAATRRGMPVMTRGWRAWYCLASKTCGIVFLLPLVWLELTCALWPRMPDDATRAWLCGIVLPAVFIAVFAGALAWNVTDQGGRCPVCLSRLSMPIRMGSWASTFDPPTMELVCEHGHGCLCVVETGVRPAGRWVPLDHSWQDLFAVKAS